MKAAHRKKLRWAAHRSNDRKLALEPYFTQLKPRIAASGRRGKSLPLPRLLPGETLIFQLDDVYCYDSLGFREPTRGILHLTDYKLSFTGVRKRKREKRRCMDARFRPRFRLRTMSPSPTTCRKRSTRTTTIQKDWRDAAGCPRGISRAEDERNTLSKRLASFSTHRNLTLLFQGTRIEKKVYSHMPRDFFSIDFLIRLPRLVSSEIRRVSCVESRISLWGGIGYRRLLQSNFQLLLLTNRE